MHTKRVILARFVDFGITLTGNQMSDIPNHFLLVGKFIGNLFKQVFASVLHCIVFYHL